MALIAGALLAGEAVGAGEWRIAPVGILARVPRGA